MKVSTILDKIDSGDIALPVFQRGYVWTVPGFMDTGLGGEFVNASIA